MKFMRFDTRNDLKLLQRIMRKERILETGNWLFFAAWDSKRSLVYDLVILFLPNVCTLNVANFSQYSIW